MMIVGLTHEQAAFFLILAVAVVLLVTEKVRQDLIALMLILSLYSAGLLESKESLAGFSSEAAITVAGIFVLGAALHATGVSDAIGDWIGRKAGTSYARSIAVLMPSVAMLSAFTHHVASTALMLPVVLELSKRQNTAPSKLLMPLSIAASLGTTITIIGAPAFLIASSLLQNAGRPGLGIFSVAPIGLALTAMGTLFILALGWRLLPSREGPQKPARLFRLDRYLTELAVLAESPHLGKSVGEAQKHMRSAMEVLGLRRRGREMRGPEVREQTIEEGDVLIIKTLPEEIVAIRKEHGIEIDPMQKYGSPAEETREEKDDVDRKLVQAVVAPQSDLIGQSIGQVDFRKRFEAIVVGIWRKAGWLDSELSKTVMQAGDILLLHAEPQALSRIMGNPAFLLLVPFHSEARLPRKASTAGLIMAATVASSAFGLLPVELAALAGAGATVLMRCLSARQAYEAIDTRIYVFIAGAVPLGNAMEKCGASALIANLLQGSLASVPEFWVLLALFGIVSVLTQFMSDAATTAIFGPVAIALAYGLKQAPEAYVVTVAMAAVVAFLTPIGHHGNLLIYGPGGYKFTDFVKVGTPLTILAGVVVATLAPLLWQ